ncbi:hypothetical protein V5S96_10980 [Corynebacterium mastitidis]|uniref:Integrase SAM-like N-terminal domain-containing protein n=2 Tax=Corynebacterium mastitidis TaxID=161890 RepID=A0ABU8P3D0_9CORY
MASITKYASARAKSGYAWRVQYRGPDGKSHTKRGFATKNAAQKWAEKNAVAVSEGTWIDPQHRKITVEELGTRWLTMQGHLKPSTMRVTEQSWRVHVLPYWGTRRIGEIMPSEVQEWVMGIERSASIVRKAHACLAQVLDLAVQDHRLERNPARGIKLPRKAKGTRVYLTAEQLKTLADEAKYPELVWLLGTVG